MTVNPQLLQHMGRSAALLGLFALVGTALVAGMFITTAPRIASAERAALLRSINAVLPAERYDNDIFQDTIEVTNPDLLGSGESIQVFRARMQGQPVGVAFTTYAPDGYTGPIKLLVGIKADGSLSGVRVLSHAETPGLGDKIEERRHPWILGFDGRSLQNPDTPGWAVRRDGGEFDQFTGATITPRAVVKAVHKALLFYQQQRETLLAPSPAAAAALPANLNP